MARRSASTARAILFAGLAAGAADILTAFAIYRPATPVQILQSVAAGLQGTGAFGGGLLSAGLGLAAHFLISIAFAGLYLATAGPAPYCRAVPCSRVSPAACSSTG